MNNQTSNPNQKKKLIASLVLGIVSIVLFVIGYISLQLIEGIIPIIKIPSIILSISILTVSPLIALIGLIFGIKDLRSSKKKLAIIGIGLCVIVLIWTLWLLGELFVIDAGF